MRVRHELMTRFSDLMTQAALEVAGDTATLQVTVTEDWLQGKSPYGGLQGAIGARALRAAVGDDAPMLRALQTTFVAAAEPGPLRAVARVVRRGRAITHAQCTLETGAGTMAILVGMFGAPRASEVSVPMPMPADLKTPDVLREVPYMPAAMPGFLRHFRQRWATGSIPYTGQPYRPSAMWARLRDASPDEGEPPDAYRDPALREAALVALTDMPPSPAIAMLSRRAPGASLTWLLEPLADARRVDPSDWVLMATETRHAADGYTSQTARMWNPRGEPVAVSHQTTAIFG